MVQINVSGLPADKKTLLLILGLTTLMIFGPALVEIGLEIFRNNDPPIQAPEEKATLSIGCQTVNPLHNEQGTDTSDVAIDKEQEAAKYSNPYGYNRDDNIRLRKLKM